MARNKVPIILFWAIVLLAAGTAAAAIDTSRLEQPWPRQLVQELEVGRDTVRWRQRVSKSDGLFAGVRFDAPLSRPAVWERASAYHDIGRTVPGVRAVRVLEDTSTHQVIQVDATVLWKTLTLTFEVEKEPPRAMRFRLTNTALGEYRGVCLFEDAARPSPGHPRRVASQSEALGVGDGSAVHREANGRPAPATTVDLATWLKPARPVPLGLLLVVERIVLLQGVKQFLRSLTPSAGSAKI